MKPKNILQIIGSLILIFICSCNKSEIKITPGQEYMFYPPLPNNPRYQYLTTFSTAKDIKKKESKFFKFIAGDDKKAPQIIKKPYGISIHDSIIYVCDMGSGVIETLNLKTRKFGYIGFKGNGKLARPVNLFIDKKNLILYVADNGRKQVLSFSLDGKFIRAYGVQNQFTPVDVAVKDDNIFICCIKKHQVFVLERSSGRLLYKIGKPGSKDGELFHPTNICIQNERLYVSDTSNFRIQVFDLNGKFLAKFGKIGRRPGNFSRNKGIALDKEERIYVVDAAFENVQVFDKNFKLLLFMFGPGRERHNINLPADIAIDYDNMNYFKRYISPKFNADYLLFVTSNFGLNKINVYAFGHYNR